MSHKQHKRLRKVTKVLRYNNHKTKLVKQTKSSNLDNKSQTTNQTMPPEMKIKRQNIVSEPGSMKGTTEAGTNFLC